MIRVLMFVPQYPYPVVGGLEKQAHELARALIRRGVSVQVLTGKINAEQDDQHIVEDVPVSRIPWSRFKPARVAAAPIAIGAHMWRRRETFDVVHVHQYSWASLFVIVLAKLMGKSVLAKLANVGDFGLPSIRRGLLGPVKQAIFLSSDSIVAMSRESLAELEEVGYPAGRVLGTPNGIPLELSTQAQHPEGRPCQVVFVGRLDEQKRLDVLLGVWADICESKLEPHLHIWGQGPLDAELRRQAARLKIEGNLTFGGQVEGVPKRLAEMDVFVLPSQAEGNSNALLEAMAAGLPIVSTSVGGTAMQVGVEGQAFLCRPGDGEALKAALTRLIWSPPLRRSIGAAMRRRAEEHFDIEKVAATYASAYQRLISRRRESVSLVSNAIIRTGSD